MSVHAAFGSFWSGSEKGVAVVVVAVVAAAAAAAAAVVAVVVAAAVAAQKPLAACETTQHSWNLIQNHRRAASIQRVGTG